MGLKIIDNSKMQDAWVFPGQGSQKIGMAKKVIKLQNAKERFDYASNLFKKDLYKICEGEAISNNENNDLNQTQNTQICLFLIESLLLDALKNDGYEPNYIAGHSLGEVTGLYAANVLTLEDCISLIKIRSELMANAAEGGMAALIGFDRDELDYLIENLNDVVIANDNSSSQVVLSGSKDALEDLSTKINCKRFISLNVSGAFHSEYMRKPSLKFSEYLKTLNFHEASYPIISNSEPTFSRDPKELKLRFQNQMSNGVRWRETMDLMIKEAECLHIIEIGPSNILGGLAKRHLKGVKITQISSWESIHY